MPLHGRTQKPKENPIPEGESSSRRFSADVLRASNEPNADGLFVQRHAKGGEAACRCDELSFVPLFRIVGI